VVVGRSRREILRLAVLADVDPRVAEDEVSHPERWSEPGPNRARERVREHLRSKGTDGQVA
jgi:hypothetical protein